MRLRHAVPTTLALLALAAPAAAHADDEPYGTTDGGGYISIDRVDLPERTTVKEGRRRQGRAVLRCRFDACRYTLGSRDGTARFAQGDYNPFRFWQRDLVKGQTVYQPYLIEALEDSVVEPTETFQFYVRTEVQSEGGPWYETESVTNVSLRNTTPHRLPSTSIPSTPRPYCLAC